MAWEVLKSSSKIDNTAKTILIVKEKTGGVTLTFNCSTTKYIESKKFMFYEVMHDVESNKFGLKLLTQQTEYSNKINFIKNHTSQNASRRISNGFAKEWKSLCNTLSVPSFNKSIKYELIQEADDFLSVDCSKPIKVN